ncbi:MAG: hypothetical protein ABS942_12220 [Solibacillus sp.]
MQFWGKEDRKGAFLWAVDYFTKHELAHAEHEHILKYQIVERFALLTNTLLEVVNE